MRILSVRPSVRPSVTRVYCDKTVERSVQIYIPYERTFSLVFWEEEWLVGGDPFYVKFRPPLEWNGRPAPLWKSQIALLGMMHLVYLMNSPLISASLVRHSLLHFHLSHMAVHHLHHLHYHRLHLLLLAQYFILNSTPMALQQILSSIDLFLSYRTDYTDSRAI